MPEDISSNNKRIAKNTLYLYVRMAVVMAVSLFTSRIVLKTLGVSDYGVYNVVGGVIGMLGYVNTLLAGGTSRFLTIALGESNFDNLKITFSTTFVLTIFTSFLVLLLGETVGLWFVINKLNVSSERADALFWVYQCALISSALTIAQSPFTASIVSHEKMNIYAYMSIFDVLIKLVVVYILVVCAYDKLKLYAVLMLVVNVLNVIIYRVYCIRNFEECTFSFKFDRTIFKKMFNYSGWNMFGSLSAILMNQGVAVVLNMFFGTVVNAAKGVAIQVCSVVQQLYSNFQLAARPQIIKYYSQSQFEEMFTLMINTSKYCSFLLLCVLIPLIVNLRGLLSIWLVEVPDYSVEIGQLSLLYLLFRSIDEPLTAGIHAVGKMKLPNLTTAMINMMVCPLTWLVCKLGGSPISANVIFVADAPIILMIDLWMLHRFIQFPVIRFLKHAVFPVVKFSIIAVAFPLIIEVSLPHVGFYCILSSLLSAVYVVTIIFIFALPAEIRDSVISKFKKNRK